MEQKGNAKERQSIEKQCLYRKATKILHTIFIFLSSTWLNPPHRPLGDDDLYAGVVQGPPLFLCQTASRKRKGIYALHKTNNTRRIPNTKLIINSDTKYNKILRKPFQQTTFPADRTGTCQHDYFLYQQFEVQPQKATGKKNMVYDI